MNEQQAIQALAALAQEHRMRVFRDLIRAGPAGRPAGVLGRRLNLSPSNVSFHLAQLERAGLLRSWRVQRHVFYAVEIDGMRQLLSFLTQECCDGHPELCGELGTIAAVCEPSEEEVG